MSGRAAEELQRSMILRLQAHKFGTIAAGAVSESSVEDLDAFWKNTALGGKTTLVIIPNKNQDDYAKIKRLSDLVHGVHSVCAIAGKIKYYDSPNKFQAIGYANQHLDNFALKFNLKTGGVNHKLFNNYLGADKENTIIFGADVAHPGVGVVAGMPSIACVVASLDSDFQNYPGSMRLQAGGQEVSVSPSLHKSSPIILTTVSGY
jgi:hypothetical protein